MAAHSPQPTDHDPEAGSTLNRREFAKAVGMAAAIGGGSAASSSGTASAQVGGLVMTPTAPTVTGLLFAEAVDRAINNEDPTRDQVTLHNQVTGAQAWWDAVLDMIRDSRMQDAGMAANIEARNAFVRAWENGDTQSECRDAALAAIREFFDVPATNATETFASALAEIGYAARAARADSDINNRFVAFTISDAEYSNGSNTSLDPSGTKIWPGDEPNLTTNTIELPSGATADVDAPDLTQAWDSGDSITISLEDVQNGYDAENDVVVLDTQNGETVETSGGFNVQNVLDTDLKSRTLLFLTEWASVMDEIETLSTQVAANYDTSLAEKLYSALDDGTISPADVRGVEGLASHLSGSTDATSSRYQMALLTTLGLERADLGSVASMTAEYSGYTDRSLSRSGSGEIDSVTLTTSVDGETMAGQLFADLRGDTTLSAGETYLANPITHVASDGGTMAVSADGSRLWTYQGHGGESLAVDSGEDLVVSGARSSQTHGIDPSDGSQIWTYDHGTDMRVMSVALGESIVLSGDANNNLHGIDPSDGSEVWVRSIGSSVEGCEVVDGTGYAIDGSTFYAIDLEDGSDLWTIEVGAGQALDITDGMAAVCGNSSTTVIDISEQSEVWSISAPQSGRAVAIDSDRGQVYTGRRHGGVFAYDLEDGSELWRFTAVSTHAFGLAVDPGGRVYSCSDGEVYAIDPSDGAEIWASQTSNYGKGLSLWAPDDASGVVGRGLFYDAPDGEEFDLVHGTISIAELTDSDGNTIDESESFDWERPDHDSTDMSEYRGQVEESSEENEGAIAEEEEASGPGPIFDGGNPLEGGGLVGLAIIGVVVLAVVGFVTDLIPGLGN